MKRMFLLAGIGLAALVSGATAQGWIEEMRPTPTPRETVPEKPDPRVIDVDPGFARTIRFETSFRTIIVGNPDVARVTAQSDRLLSVNATAANGTTNLIVLDEAGNEIFSGVIRVVGRNVRRVEIVSKKRLHEYWAYICSATSCQRTKDDYEGTPDPLTSPPAQVIMPIGPTTVQSPPTKQ